MASEHLTSEKLKHTIQESQYRNLAAFVKKVLLILSKYSEVLLHMKCNGFTLAPHYESQ